jgi:hypothetical protein
MGRAMTLPNMPAAQVLDSHALLMLLRDEPGADAVAQILEKAGALADTAADFKSRFKISLAIGLERHGEEFLQFPVAALGGVDFELFRRAKQRPLQIGGGEVDAAPIGVGIVIVQSVSARTDDAPVNDDGFEFKLRRRFAISQAIFEMFQDFQLG